MKLLFIGVIVLCFSVGAQQEYQPEGGEFRPRKMECRKELRSLCAGRQGKDFHVCRKEKLSQLSQVCQKIIGRKLMKNPMKDCEADAEKFCKGKKRKARFKCLMKNKSKFSETCQQAMGRRMGRQMDRKMRRSMRRKMKKKFKGQIMPIGDKPIEPAPED